MIDKACGCSTMSCSWPIAIPLHSDLHNQAAMIGIVASLSAMAGAMVAVHIMKRKDYRNYGNDGDGHGHYSPTRMHDDKTTTITTNDCSMKWLRRRLKYFHSLHYYFDEGGTTTVAAPGGRESLERKMKCCDDSDTAATCVDDTTAPACVTPTTICSSQTENHKNHHLSSREISQVVNLNNNNSTVHFAEPQNQSDRKVDNPSCECSCSACSFCFSRIVEDSNDNYYYDDEEEEDCPGEVLLPPYHRKSRQYAQTRPSSLTTEGASAPDDNSLLGSSSCNRNNNRADESDMRTSFRNSIATSSCLHDDDDDDNDDDDDDDIADAKATEYDHVDYIPRRACAQSKSSNSQYAKRIKLYIRETELQFKGEEEFDESIVSAAKDSDSLHVLRRSRAVSALANRLMAATDEAHCLKEVTRLMILMFDLEKVTFAMLTGSDHFYMKRIVPIPRKNGNTSSSSYSSTDFELDCLDSDDKRPLDGTAAGVCIRTLKEHYTPHTKDSSFATHRVFYENGYNTVLVTPILVNGNKCAGCILLSKQAQDAFPKSDRVIISDIGLILGANIYAKRLLQEADESKKRSRDMLHSFMPPQVLQKIECYWDSNSDEYKARQQSRHNSSYSSTSSPPSDNEDVRTNSWYVAQTEWPVQQNYDDGNADGGTQSKQGKGIKKRIEYLRNLNYEDSKDLKDNVGVIVKRSGTELLPSKSALYAEAVKDVCIIFTDIVGFSTMSMHLPPITIMDMLQDLYSRFDELCDVHGVMKLETIGDAYICATNLLEDDKDGVGLQNAAVRALAMAKDMVLEAVNTQIPKFQSFVDDKNHADDDIMSQFETLGIRVGIHVGDVMCGVLGQRLPKFTTCGKAVNMAARMEQTSQSNRIRVTKDFHDLIGDAETGWLDKEVIALKNMGDMETYLLDPLELRIFENKL